MPHPTPRPAAPARRNAGAAVMVLALAAIGALLAGCTSGSSVASGSGSGSSSGGSGPAPETTQSPPPASIVVEPAAGAVDVSPVAPITVTANGGALDTVTMTNAEGEPVAGKLAPDGAGWTVAEPLGYGKAYEITATATGEDGKPVTTTSGFTTVTPGATAFPSMNPTDGQTVGVGQPLAIYFDQDVQNKQAAEDAITVTTDPVADGAFYWFSDSEVHWRPKEYWAAGTRVDVDIALYGKDLGGGVYGQEDRNATFTIGDAVIARADGASHQMTVEINGRVARTMPISMGSPDFPSYDGIHVVTERHESYTMDSSTYGLAPSDGGYVTNVRYATRISNSGQFVHAAPWSVGDQGNTNVSHGCVNLSTENARWFYDTIKKGDIVIQSNTGGPELEPYNGFGDWQIPWDQWISGGEA